MCQQCKDVMHEVAELVQPLVKEAVLVLYEFLEGRIYGYERDSPQEIVDFIDTVGECLIGGLMASKVPPVGPGWSDLRRRVTAERWAKEARKNGT